MDWAISVVDHIIIIILLLDISNSTGATNDHLIDNLLPLRQLNKFELQSYSYHLWITVFSTLSKETSFTCRERKEGMRFLVLEK